MEYQVFVDAMSRDSQLPSPKRGASCTILSTGEFQIYYGPKVGWRPPWNLPWGEVDRAELNAFYQFQTVDNLEPSFGEVSFVPCVGRRYEMRWRLTVETGDAGQAGDVGMALVTNVGSTAAASFAALAGQFILDGVVLPKTDIPTFYPFRWRREIAVSRDITPLCAPNVAISLVPQFAYGSANPDLYLFTSTTDGVYGNNDPGSETSFTVHDVGPWLDLDAIP